MKNKYYRRKKRNFITKDTKQSMLDKGKQISSAFFVFAIINLILTIIVPVSLRSDPVVVYSRNFSSVALYFLLGFYFRAWGSKNKYLTSKNMKRFKIFTLVTALACLAKAALTASFFYRMNIDFTLAGLYYIGEMILWTALAIFFAFYFKMLLPCQVIKGDPKSVNDMGHFL